MRKSSPVVGYLGNFIYPDTARAYRSATWPKSRLSPNTRLSALHSDRIVPQAAELMSPIEHEAVQSADVPKKSQSRIAMKTTQRTGLHGCGGVAKQMRKVHNFKPSQLRHELDDDELVLQAAAMDTHEARVDRVARSFLSPDGLNTIESKRCNLVEDSKDLLARDLLARRVRSK